LPGQRLSTNVSLKRSSKRKPSNACWAKHFIPEETGILEYRVDPQEAIFFYKIVAACLEAGQNKDVKIEDVIEKIRM
jgi:hypothetical protein